MSKMVPKEIEKELKGKSYDIVVGIPSYNNVQTIGHVAKIVDLGIQKYFHGKGLIVNSDGGSKDGTKEGFLKEKTKSDKIAYVYNGVAGKGSAMGSVMEISSLINAPVTVFVDSDLRSIEPWWIERLTKPIVDGESSYVTPYYVRHKYDGTITNNICYPLTSILYGQKVRQPIGGDFGVSLEMIQKYISKPTETWQSDVARFGIDIWMTTTAMCEGNKPVWQAALGAKIHDVKDPGKQLGPMFKQVVGTLLELMEKYESIWMRKEIESVRAPIFGDIPNIIPEPVDVDIDNLKKVSSGGINENWKFISSILPQELLNTLENSRKNGKLDSEGWIKVVYEFASLYRKREIRDSLIHSLVPIYFARVASFVEETYGKSEEFAEEMIEKQLKGFERQKEYLKKRWND